MTDDAELLLRYAKDRSEAAFAELVRRHIDLVYSVALRQVGGDTHLAQDVAQIAFSALSRHAAEVGRRQVVVGWLYRTAQNAATDCVRRERRRREREMKAAIMNEPYDSADWDRVRPLLDRAMSDLGDIERTAVLLRFFCGQSYAEVGRQLSMSENASRMRVERALEKLNVRLEQQGVTSTAAALGVALTHQAAFAAPSGLAASIAGASVAAAETAPPLFALLQFMSTTKFVGSIAATVLFLAITGTLHVSQRKAEAERLLAVATRSSEIVLGQLKDVQQRAAIAEREVAGLQNALDETRRAPRATDNRTSPPISSHNPATIGKEFFSAHPEGPRALADYTRHMATMRYHALIRKLGLTAPERDQFLALTAQLDAGISWNTMSQAPFASFQAGETSLQQLQESLRELLGAERYKQYREFDRVNGARRMVEEVAKNSYYTATPLSSEQARRLLEIVVENGPNYRSGDFLLGRNSGLVNLDWDKVLTEAGHLLSPVQVATLVGMRDRNHFDRAMNQATGQAMREAKLAAGIPPEF